MSPKSLKVGDKIRIISVPGGGVPGYYIHKGTVRVYKKIIARKRAVRISEIDEGGTPWYTVKLRQKNGTWACNHLAVLEDDQNWVKVKPRRVKTQE
jgi:hypothetical protein